MDADPMDADKKRPAVAVPQGDAPRGGLATGMAVIQSHLATLPGSPGACKDAWDEILKWQLDFRHQPCNFVEIMPRLDEHMRRK